MWIKEKKIMQMQKLDGGWLYEADSSDPLSSKVVIRRSEDDNYTSEQITELEK